MNDPNVNNPITKNKERFVIEFGSCWVHIVHGVLQTRISQSDWNFYKVLHAMCFLFKTRWVEDGPAASQAIEIWQCVTMVVKYWLSQSKSKQPKNKSFDTLFEHHIDQLMIGKLQFFNLIILHPC